MKNPTPKTIALISSGIISLVFLLSLIAFKIILSLSIPWIIVLVFPVLSFIFSFLVFINALEIFIYRKIKIIYKIIASSKSSKDKVNSVMKLSNDIIHEVEKEVINNISEENKEIEHLKRMEEYRRQFLGNVSHELKTPLFHIQGYIETLIDGALYDDAVNAKYLKKAAKNVDRLNAIVTDLEMISLIEDGKLNIEMEKLNIWELVNETFDSLALFASQHEVTMKFKNGFMNPCFVRADKERIRQVLVNLFTNAIKYNKQGGKVTVGAYDMDQKILIEVSDNGIGIDYEHIPRIFERFYRIDTSRSREKGGTGLGLAIVKHIIEAHNQSINVRSTINEGSTFAFTLEKVQIQSSKYFLM